MADVFTIKNKINEFFADSSIQRADRFYVDIDTYHTLGEYSEGIQNQEIELTKRGYGLKHLPIIRNHQIVNVTIPTWDFTKVADENTPYKYSFSTYAWSAFDMPILFNEDKYGSVSRLSDWCQKRIVDPNNFYYSPELQRVLNIKISVIGDDDRLVMSYEAKNAWFVKQAVPTFDSTTSVPLVISITFGCDNVDYKNYRYDPDTQ